MNDTNTIGQEDEEVDRWLSATRSSEFVEQATDLVNTAFAKLNEGYPNNLNIHRKLLARRQRIDGKFDAHMSFITSVVNEWLSARKRLSDGSAPSATLVREAIQDVLRAEVEAGRMQRRFGNLSASLRCATLSDEGDHIAEMASLAHDKLVDAWFALNFARAVVLSMEAALPPNCSGAGGLVGKISELPPDMVCAVKLAHVWINLGLSPRGGIVGDGLDVFIGTIMNLEGKPLEKFMTKVRAKLKEHPP